MLSSLVTQHLAQFARVNTKTHGEPPRRPTLDAHRLQLERFAFSYDRQFADLSGLTVNWCKDWILDLAQRTGQSNVNQALSALAGFLAYLTDGGLWMQDQLESWRRFHEQQYCRVRPISTSTKHLSGEKLELLFSALARTGNRHQADRDVAFFGTVFFGLTRPAELRRLCRRDVQFRAAEGERPDSYLISVPRSITKDHADRRAEIFRGACIGDVDVFLCFQRYQEWRAQNGPQDENSPFFIGIRQGEQDRTSRRLWNKLFKRAVDQADPDGIKGLKYVTPYWCRHTTGEHLPGRLPDREIQQLFGHSAARTTEGYTNHQNEERLAESRLAAHHALLQAINQ